MEKEILKILIRNSNLYEKIFIRLHKKIVLKIYHVARVEVVNKIMQ